MPRAFHFPVLWLFRDQRWRREWEGKEASSQLHVMLGFLHHFFFFFFYQWRWQRLWCSMDKIIPAILFLSPTTCTAFWATNFLNPKNYKTALIDLFYYFQILACLFKYSILWIRRYMPAVFSHSCLLSYPPCTTLSSYSRISSLSLSLLKLAPLPLQYCFQDILFLF